jgi:hypothetical protein
MLLVLKKGANFKSLTEWAEYYFREPWVRYFPAQTCRSTSRNVGTLPLMSWFFSFVCVSVVRAPRSLAFALDPVVQCFSIAELLQTLYSSGSVFIMFVVAQWIYTKFSGVICFVRSGCLRSRFWSCVSNRTAAKDPLGRGIVLRRTSCEKYVNDFDWSELHSWISQIHIRKNVQYVA